MLTSPSYLTDYNMLLCITQYYLEGLIMCDGIKQENDKVSSAGYNNVMPASSTYTLAYDH